MKCKSCKREIADNSIFCNWCGTKQLKEKKVIKVPAPRQLPSGQWNIYLRAEGQSITEPTPERCTAKAQAIRAGFIEAKKKAPGLTLRDACLKHIESNRGRLSPSTIQGYEKIVRNQFPDLMAKRLSAIDPATPQEAVNEECRRPSQRGKPYSTKSVRSAYAYISEVLEANGLDLPTPKLPELKRKPVRILRPEQIFEAVRGTEIELPCLLAMWMTFTISEIRGFTKSRSIHNGQISVVETVVDIGGKPVRKPYGKEEERSRTLDIPPYIMALIDAVEGDVICPLSSQAVNKRLQRRLEKFGYPPISFHKLRHVAASSAAGLKIPDAYIRERGGWKSDHIMKSVYTHTFTAERRAADAAIDAHFEAIVSTHDFTDENKKP